MSIYRTIYDEKTKTWSGLKTVPVFNPNASAGHVLLEALRRNPRKIGQVRHNRDKILSVFFVAIIIWLVYIILCVRMTRFFFPVIKQ